MDLVASSSSPLKGPRRSSLEPEEPEEQLESSPVDRFETSKTSSLNEASASPAPTSLERRGVDLAAGVDLAIGGGVVVVLAVFAGGMDDGADVVDERGEILLATPDSITIFNGRERNRRESAR